MEEQIARQTQQRLKHALARLKSEPRSSERRTGERRSVQLIVAHDRRILADRRKANRRSAS
jgi:hypothetical protein